MGMVESEARKALARLQRSLEKTRRELEALSGAIRHAEGDEYPEHRYAEARTHVETVLDFTREESERLQAKILETGGLEPGRVRRSSSL